MNWPILGLRDVDPRPDMTVEARAEQAELAGRLVDAYTGGDSLIRDMLGLVTA